MPTRSPGILFPEGGEVGIGQTDTNKYASLWDLVVTVVLLLYLSIFSLLLFSLPSLFWLCSASLSPSLVHVMLWTVEKVRYFIWNNQQTSFLTTATRKLIWQAKRQSVFLFAFSYRHTKLWKSLICTKSLSFQLVKLLNMCISHLWVACNGWLAWW